MDKPTQVIPKNQLIHGFYYRGRGAQVSLARWNGEIKKFIYRAPGQTSLKEMSCAEDQTGSEGFLAEAIVPPEHITHTTVISFEKYHNQEK